MLATNAATHATIATRDATTDDLGALADMGVRFVEWSPYSALGVTRDEIAAGIMRVIDCGGFVRVLEHGGRVVGMLIGALAPMWFGPSVVVAAELAWWVDPEHRHGGSSLRLLRDFEAWGKGRGARLATGSDLLTASHSAARIYEAFGYREVERAWVKDLR